eukprot:s7845_g6.t1
MSSVLSLSELGHECSDSSPGVGGGPMLGGGALEVAVAVVVLGAVLSAVASPLRLPLRVLLLEGCPSQCAVAEAGAVLFAVASPLRLLLSVLLLAGCPPQWAVVVVAGDPPSAGLCSLAGLPVGPAGVPASERLCWNRLVLGGVPRAG